MDVEELRARQAPLKDRYTADAESARVPLSAQGDWRDPAVTCTVGGWAGPVTSALHPALGGDPGGACSGDMLLEAVVACAGVTLRSVATAMRLNLADVQVRAEAIFDARGTMGLDRSVPVGIQELVLTATVVSDADDATLQRLGSIAERYCVVGQSLAVPPSINVVRR